MENEVVIENVPDEEQVADTGAYKDTTTTSRFITDPRVPPKVTKRVVSKPLDLVVVTPKEDRTMIFAKKWYHLKRGEQLAVPPAMKQALVQCDVIVER
jgi:hypothetical protein